MDLDDSFTERLLHRNEARKQFKLTKENETPEVLIKKRPALIEEQQIANQDSVDHSPKRPCDDLEDSPKRQCLEQCKGSPSRHWPPPKHETVLQDKENIPSKESSMDSFVPFKSSFNVRGLAALRKTHDNGSSVISSRLTSEADNDCSTYVFSTNSSELCKGRKARLAGLAADVNQWEDDLHHSKTSTNSANSLHSKSSKEHFNTAETKKNSFHNLQRPLIEIHPNSVKQNSKFFDENSCSATSDVKGLSKRFNVGNEENIKKTGIFGQAIKGTLETEVKKSPTKSFRDNDENVFIKNDVLFDKKGSSCNIAKRKLQQIVNKETSQSLNTSFDPTHLSISDRKALFESGIQKTKKIKQCTIQPKLSVAQRAALFENAVQKSSVSNPISSNKSKIVPPPQSPSKTSKIDNIIVQSSPVTPEKSNFQSKDEVVHWFLCLIRYGAQVIVTQMVSTDDKISNGALKFTNHIKLQNLPPDFSIIFEVYALQTKKEHLPHDKKYHIKRDKSTIRLTNKGKKADNKLALPSISSPGGPNAVRSPSFAVIGFTRFTIHNCNKKCFTLDKIPFTSPLEGILRVKLHLNAEHKVMEKGFLTMFEDVSGFGAWHRRWCALNAQHLTYWKYPEDECKKAPIGSIDLKQCVTAQVKPVTREICARPNTFQLVIVRPQSKDDKNTLISYCSNTITTIKHLLSADTKEERNIWCGKLNEALTTVRKWDPQALRPTEANQDVA